MPTIGMNPEETDEENVELELLNGRGYDWQAGHLELATRLDTVVMPQGECIDVGQGGHTELDVT